MDKEDKMRNYMGNLANAESNSTTALSFLIQMVLQYIRVGGIYNNGDTFIYMAFK